MNKYRLPGADGMLSGEIEATYKGVTSDNLFAYTVRIEGYGVVDLRFPSLLELVRPPSIDDPVELPLDFEDIDGDRFHLEAIPPVDAAKRGHVAFLRSASYLTRERCRDAARALWLLGNREASS